MLEKGAKIQPAQGKVGILLVGLGAVSTTFIAGVEAIKKKIAKPIGSLTQIGHIRLGKRTEKRNPLIKEFVPLARLEDLVFAAWDIFPDSAYEAAAKAQVLKKEDLEAVRPELEAVRPWKAVFDKNYVKRLDGPNVKTGKNKRELADQLIAEIEKFKTEKKLSRLVMIWCGSTEVFLTPQEVHKNLKNFEKGLENNDSNISPNLI